MRTCYDAIPSKAGNIPSDAQMVAGYVDGLYAWSQEDWASFPGAVCVGIVVFASTNAGQVLDVENGDATPGQAPAWCQMRRAAGQIPTVYCNLSMWPTAKAAFAASGIPEPEWWIADYTGLADIPPGAVAHQFSDSPPGNPYDTSAVADFWPGVDQPKEEEMANAYRAMVTVPVGAAPDVTEAQYLFVLDPGYKVWIDAGSVGGIVAACPDPVGGAVTLSAEFAARIPTLGPEAPGYTGTPYGVASGGVSAAAVPLSLSLSGSMSGVATPQ